MKDRAHPVGLHLEEAHYMMPQSSPTPRPSHAPAALPVLALALACTLAPTAAPAAAQTFPTDDPVIRAIWTQGMGDPSQVERLAQALMDSIGPRLYGSPSEREAADWLLANYARWGVEARREQYGTWRG